MKRILLAGTAVAAMTSASFAADYAAPAEIDVWSGYFVGIAGGWAPKDVDVTIATTPEDSIDEDNFIIGAYYGRNWQSGSWVFGLDSSFNYIALQDDDVLPADPNVVDVEANFLGLSRLKVGYAFDNTLIYAAGGLATTILEIEDDLAGEDDDDWAFGFTVGAGIEHKFSDNWSARIEYAYFNIESDDLTLPTAGDVDFEIEGHIVRGGVAYHF
jgi:outer membrane immunogenic protein